MENSFSKLRKEIAFRLVHTIVCICQSRCNNFILPFLVVKFYKEFWALTYGFIPLDILLCHTFVPTQRLKCPHVLTCFSQVCAQCYFCEIISHVPKWLITHMDQGQSRTNLYNSWVLHQFPKIQNLHVILINPLNFSIEITCKSS